MASQQHTPGPWKAAHSDPAEGADVWWIVAGAGNMQIELGSFPSGRPSGVKAANARLAAAAPDLLYALRLASSEIHNPGSARACGIDIVEVIEAALSRAA